MSHNHGTFISHCISSVLNSESLSLECIVVDNLSADNSREILRSISEPRVRCIYLDENVGPTKAFNTGARNANGKFLVFLDPDATVSKSCLRNLIEVLDSEKSIGACQAKVMMAENPRLMDCYAVGYDGKIRGMSGEKFTSLREILYAATCFGFRTDVFEKIGEFDEHLFSHWFDIDLGWRLRMHGYKIVMVPNTIAYHSRASITGKKEELIEYHKVKGYLRLWFKNLEIRYLLIHLLPIALSVGLTCIKDLRHGRYQSIRALYDFLLGLPELIDSRMKVQARRRISDEALIHFLKHILPSLSKRTTARVLFMKQFAGPSKLATKHKENVAKKFRFQ